MKTDRAGGRAAMISRSVRWEMGLVTVLLVLLMGVLVIEPSPPWAERAGPVTDFTVSR
jgi:hypothetical protein